MAVSSTLPERRKAPPTPFMPAPILQERTFIKFDVPPMTTDRVDRSSFSSVKENHDGIAQSFTDSKTSSLLRNEASYTENEDAIIDDFVPVPPVSNIKNFQGDQRGMLTNPQSNLFAFTPCDGFRGWKDIPLMAQAVKNIKSKSYSDLAKLHRGFQWESAEKEDRMDLDVVREEKHDDTLQTGISKLESLPTELLGGIIDQLVTDIPPNGFSARNIDLMSLLLTSRTMHSVTLATLYNQITIPHSRIFAKFLAQVTAHPSLGTIVRRFDFSHFNPTCAGMTARERAETLNLIPETLLRCLSLTPHLREFLAQEHIDKDISSEVLSTLLCDLPRLKALDFCACSSTSFRDAFNSVLSLPALPTTLPITRLSLHESTILPSTTFDILLPRLPHLTHLDVAHTRITSLALNSLPSTARLTHLNLSKCSFLHGPSAVDFLSTHPSTRTLIYLNLFMDSKSHELLPADLLTLLIPNLPTTLRSLNLKGSKMNPSHIPLLLPFSKHLEELGLGRHIELADIQSLLIPSPTPSPTQEQQAQTPWLPHNLRYIDISDLSSSSLDLSTLFSTTCPILKNTSLPLEVLEISDEVLKRVEKSPIVLRRVGWCVKEAGRRAWLVRIKGNGEGPLAGEGEKDDGARAWKWGACYWGMRKVPVARQEVGGMYGHYMFKR